jgi:hypothetical protein
MVACRVFVQRVGRGLLKARFSAQAKLVIVRSILVRVNYGLEQVEMPNK